MSLDPHTSRSHCAPKEVRDVACHSVTTESGGRASEHHLAASDTVSLYNLSRSLAWWHTPAVLALGRLRQEVYGFEASYIVRPCPQTTQKAVAHAFNHGAQEAETGRSTRLRPAIYRASSRTARTTQRKKPCLENTTKHVTRPSKLDYSSAGLTVKGGLEAHERAVAAPTELVKGLPSTQCFKGRSLRVRSPVLHSA